MKTRYEIIKEGNLFIIEVDFLFERKIYLGFEKEYKLGKGEFIRISEAAFDILGNVISIKVAFTENTNIKEICNRTFMSMKLGAINTDEVEIIGFVRKIHEDLKSAYKNALQKSSWSGCFE